MTAIVASNRKSAQMVPRFSEECCLRAGAPRITSVLALQSESEALAINFDRRTTRPIDDATDRVFLQARAAAESISAPIRGGA
jgi:hypothetical protein